MKKPFLFFAIIIFGLAVACSPHSDPPGQIVLKGATIIDGTGNAPIENGVLIIEGHKIQAVGKAEVVKIPKGAKVVELEGKWLTPGYIDTHMHFWESGRTWTSPVYQIDLQEYVSYEEETAFMKERIPFTLEKYVCAGITSVVPLGAVDWEYKVRALARSQRKAPNVFLAGGFIASLPVEIDNQYFDGKPTGYWAANEHEAKELIHYLDSTKVDLIKAGFIPGYADYPLEKFLPILSVLIEESHKKNLKVSVHALELHNAKEVLKVGTDVLAHTVSDRLIDAEFLDLARKNNAIITSTLGVFEGIKGVLSGTYSLDDAEICCGDPQVIQSWKEWSAILKNEKPILPAWIGADKQTLEMMLENTRRAHEAGLTICVGSDGGNIGSLHGAAFHKELRLLSEAGLSEIDILKAATINGAKAIGKANELGTLEEGKQADILIMKENPLESIKNFIKIDQVIINGEFIDRSELEEDNGS